MSETAAPDTHEMVIVHRAFRREFGLAPGLIEQVADGDTMRAAVLAEHLGDIVHALHHHHEGEDELLWPQLLERASLHADLVHRMQAQHEALSAALNRIEALLPRWAATAAAADRDELVSATRAANTVLDEHMGEEEREILPLVREHLTVEQWDKLGERGAEVFDDKAKRIAFLGMALEDTSAEEERDFLAKLPAPVRLLWKLIGRRQYAAYTRRIRTA